VGKEVSFLTLETKKNVRGHKVKRVKKGGPTKPKTVDTNNQKNQELVKQGVWGKKKIQCFIFSLGLRFGGDEKTERGKSKRAPYGNVKREIPAKNRSKTWGDTP